MTHLSQIVPTQPDSGRSPLVGCVVLALALVAVGAFWLINGLSHLGDCFARTATAGLSGSDEGPVFARHVVFHTTDDLGAQAPDWPPSARATMTLRLPSETTPSPSSDATFSVRVFSDGSATPLADTPFRSAPEGSARFDFPILRDCGKDACAAGYTIVVQTDLPGTFAWTLEAETLFGCGNEPSPNVLTASTDGSRTVQIVESQALALPRNRIDLTADKSSDTADVRLTLSPPDATWDARTGPIVEVFVTPLDVSDHPWLATDVRFSLNGHQERRWTFEDTFNRSGFSTHPFDHCSGSAPCSASIGIAFSRNTVPVIHDPPTPKPIPTDAPLAASFIISATLLELPVGASVAVIPGESSMDPTIVAIALAAAFLGLIFGVMLVVIRRRRAAS